MKIWGNIPKVSGIYGNSGKIERPSRVRETSSRKDELTISGVAKDFNTAMAALRQVPDVRQDRVNEIMQKMKNGEYSVSARDVAEKIINSGV